ncbi:MAG: BrnT family toxin [Chloroflexi bacterium]|nr:BrnT family toxin [Chloroflexota bacterium]
MRISGVIVSAETETHIWTKHHVTLEEVEEAYAGDPLVLRGREDSYVVYGRTDAGRYLIIFLYPRGQGVFALATARDMEDRERRRYRAAKER